MRMLWRYHRKAVLVAAVPVAALLLLLGLVATVLHVTNSSSQPAAAGSASPTASPSAGAPGPATTPPGGGAPAGGRTLPAVAPSDIASWDAIPPVVAAVSADYPAIAATGDPYGYAKAFVTELFNQDYRKPRAELLGWAQYESVPIVTNGLPPGDEAKGLVDSLTDSTWDREPTAPVPPAGQWLSLQAQSGYLTASNVVITADSAWQQAVSSGATYSSKEKVLLDATALVTLHTATGGQTTTSRSTVTIKIMLGASTHGAGYGAMHTGTYVNTAVS